MTTKEAMERLAKCGVVVTSLGVAEHGEMELSAFPWSKSFEIGDDHAAMLLEAAWHRKFPTHVVRPWCDHDFDGWRVEAWDDEEERWDWAYSEEFVLLGTTRLSAMVLAAEQAAKEDRTNG